MASYRDKLPASGGSAVVSVQRLTITPKAAGVTNYTIASVDMSKTFLVVSATYRDGSSAYNMLCSIRLANSTTISVTRLPWTSETETPRISIQVVSASNITVQRGVLAGFGNGDIPISAVNLAKSHANLIGHTCDNPVVNAAGAFLIAPYLSSETKITLFASNTSNISNISWEVVSYV